MSGCQEPGDLDDLRGTVKGYGRHVLVCTGDETWPTRIENKENLLGRIGRDAKASREELDPHFKVTALRTEPKSVGYDLIVFPDRVVYREVDARAWEWIRDRHLYEDRPVDDLHPSPVGGRHILVCVHMERDERCGQCGPLVHAAFEESVAERDLDDEITVHRSSHVGGHAFAGNVLVYPEGVWYGYVRPADVDTILDKHLEGEVWQEHLRGQMVR